MANLYVTPSTLEVDYDKNLTELYEAITDQKWDRAVTVCRNDPVQAATWVVRHYEDDDEIMWRFLPIHSACARQPPAYVIQALLKAYPDGAKCVDDQGMYALHYACGNQASRDVIRLLLVNFPEAATLADPRGMLPIHYLACWGPSSVAVVDMLLVAHSDVVNVRDEEGNTPLDLAKDGDYPEREAVMAALKKWMNDSSKRSGGHAGGNSTQNSMTGHSSRSSTKAGSRSLKLDVHSEDAGEEKKENDEHRYRTQSNASSSNVHTKASSAAGATSNRASRQNANYNSASAGRTVSPTQVTRLEEQVRQLQIQIKDGSSSSGGGAGGGNGSKSSAFTPSAESRDEVSRLQGEIQKLHDGLDMKKAEDREHSTDQHQEGGSYVDPVHADDGFWKHKYYELERSSLERERLLLHQLREMEDQMKEKDEGLESIRRTLESKDHMFGEKDDEISDLKKKLEQSKSERDGLRMTLTDLMEQHDRFKKKSHQLTDRLGSLSVSLESMMEQQKSVAVSLKDRNDQYRDTLRKRKEKLRELEELETTMQNDENNLEASLAKQMKEMEAIAAVIAAARE
jgi:Ankyrin repeats (3 copies)